MKKKILLGLMCFVLLLTLTTGCGNKSENDKTSSGSNESEKTKGKCSIFECMEKLDAKDTVEEMNEKIGFEGELTSDTEKYKVYNWELSNDTSITVQFNVSVIDNSISAVIDADYPLNSVSKKADFTKYDEIKDAIENGDSLTYDEFVKMVGGVKGVVDKKTASSITYYWQNSKGGYLNAYFDVKTGKCTMATGRF